MAKIQINNLPDVESISLEELDEAFGAGLRLRKRKQFHAAPAEVLEVRQMLSATTVASLKNALLGAEQKSEVASPTNTVASQIWKDRQGPTVQMRSVAAFFQADAEGTNGSGAAEAKVAADSQSTTVDGPVQVQTDINEAGAQVTSFANDQGLFRQETAAADGSRLLETWNDSGDHVATYYDQNEEAFLRVTEAKDGSSIREEFRPDSIVKTYLQDGQVYEQKVWREDNTAIHQTWSTDGQVQCTEFADNIVVRRKTWTGESSLLVEDWKDDVYQQSTYEGSDLVARSSHLNGMLTQQESWSESDGKLSYVLTEYSHGEVSSKAEYLNGQLELREQWTEKHYIKTTFASGISSFRYTYLRENGELAIREEWTDDNYTQREYAGSHLLVLNEYSRQSDKQELEKRTEWQGLQTIVTTFAQQAASERLTYFNDQLEKKEVWKAKGVFEVSSYASGRRTKLDQYQSGELKTRTEWSWSKNSNGWTSTTSVSKFKSGYCYQTENFDSKGVLRQRQEWSWATRQNGSKVTEWYAETYTVTDWNSREQKTKSEVYNSKAELTNRTEWVWKSKTVSGKTQWYASSVTTTSLNKNAVQKLEVRDSSNKVRRLEEKASDGSYIIKQYDSKGRIQQIEVSKSDGYYSLSRYDANGKIYARQINQSNGESRSEEWKSNGVYISRSFDSSRRLVSQAVRTKNVLQQYETWSYKKVGSNYQVKEYVRNDFDSKGSLTRKTTMKDGQLYRVEEWKTSSRMVGSALRRTSVNGTQKTSTYYKSGKATERYTYWNGAKEKYETWSGNTQVVSYYNRSTGKRYQRDTYTSGKQTKREEWYTDGRQVNTYYDSGRVTKRYTYNAGIKVYETWESNGDYRKFLYVNRPSITGAANYVKFYKEWHTSKGSGSESYKTPVSFSLYSMNDAKKDLEKASKSSGVNKLVSIGSSTFNYSSWKKRWDSTWKQAIGNIGVPIWLRDMLGKSVSLNNLTKPLSVSNLSLPAPKDILTNVNAGLKAGSILGVKAPKITLPPSAKAIAAEAKKSFADPHSVVASLGEAVKINPADIVSAAIDQSPIKATDFSLPDIGKAANVGLGDLAEWSKEKGGVIAQEAKELGGNIAREGKDVGGDVAREGKDVAGDIAREGKTAGGDIAREGKNAADDVAREGKKAAGDIAEEGKALGGRIADQWKKLYSAAIPDEFDQILSDFSTGVTELAQAPLTTITNMTDSLKMLNGLDWTKLQPPAGSNLGGGLNPFEAFGDIDLAKLLDPNVLLNQAVKFADASIDIKQGDGGWWTIGAKTSQFELSFSWRTKSQTDWRLAEWAAKVSYKHGPAAITYQDSSKTTGVISMGYDLGIVDMSAAWDLGKRDELLSSITYLHEGGPKKGGASLSSTTRINTINGSTYPGSVKAAGLGNLLKSMGLERPEGWGYDAEIEAKYDQKKGLSNTDVEAWDFNLKASIDVEGVELKADAKVDPTTGEISKFSATATVGEKDEKGEFQEAVSIGASGDLSTGETKKVTVGALNEDGKVSITGDPNTGETTSVSAEVKGEDGSLGATVDPRTGETTKITGSVKSDDGEVKATVDPRTGQANIQATVVVKEEKAEVKPAEAKEDFVGPPAPGEDFVGPPAPGEDFVGPPAPGEDFVGPPAPGEDFVGPPAPGAYSEAVLARIEPFKTLEGTKPHIGSDSGNITLPFGIVADSGVKHNGKEVTAGDFKGIPFPADEIDFSEAVKDGIKRSDFDSDEAWAKDVIALFENRVKDRVPNYDQLAVNEQQALIDIAWNLPDGAIGFEGTKTLLKEFEKAPEDRSPQNLLSTAQYHYTSITRKDAETGKDVKTYFPMKGLVKRRAAMYNLLAAEGQKATAVRQTTQANGKPLFEILNAKGEVLAKFESKHPTDKSRSADGTIDID
ncbi:toxin-antitoxin system YwqK family antitoxin [Lignipirellula cremea]|uniref:Uncharacterized protein n=1 Tax=Lignipirellula cremea TaxID=2528010 RepID=A0A518DRS7_9BACT|nr:hypothetical protein [Lignipirellula cremea]QDU94536.1 hypothetical protein Pla8534_23270 [Lignipirellula cremea]